MWENVQLLKWRVSTYTPSVEIPKWEWQRFFSGNDNTCEWSRKKLFKQKLMLLKFTLISSTAGAIIDSEVVYGLTDDTVRRYSRKLWVFTSDVAISKFLIWSFTTAVEIRPGFLEKNLSLYLSFCSDFPAEIFLKFHFSKQTYEKLNWVWE